MDPFAEKDLIENLKSIASSLRNMDRKMDELIRSVQDFGADISETDDIADSEPENKV
jgi:ABC-type transporter Mla subunit MlaD